MSEPWGEKLTSTSSTAVRNVTVGDRARYWWWFAVWRSSQLLVTLRCPWRRRLARIAIANCAKCYVSPVNDSEL